jgi:hypothetical protein
MDSGSINSDASLTSSSKIAFSSSISGESNCESILAEKQALRELYGRAALSYINEKCTTKDSPDNLILSKMANKFSYINTMISNLKPFQSSLSGMEISKEISRYNLLFIHELKKLLLSWCQDYKLAKKANLKKNMQIMIDKWVEGFPHYTDQMHSLTTEICDTFESQISLLENDDSRTEEDLVDNFVHYIVNKYPNVIWSKMDNTLLTLPEPHTKELLYNT